MRNRSGFTIVELLVSVAIVGLLMSLVVVGVQRTRATARKMQCINNLKQIGIAAHTSQSSRGYFPAKGHEAWADIYQAMGYPLERGIFGVPLWTPPFVCPQDDFSGDTTNCSRSYVMNAGTHFRLLDENRNGYSLDSKQRYPADISDGQSQTAMFSERLIIDGSATEEKVRSEPRRYLWWTSQEVARTPGNEAAAIQECETGRTSQLPPRIWNPTSPGKGYDHRLPPNRPGCWNGDYLHAYQHDAIVPASSNHSEGVNVLYIDGHVKTISDSIDATVWWAIGTINGGESVGGD